MGSLLGFLCVSFGWGQWKPHDVTELNGKSGQIKLPSKFQIVTESWHEVTATPYLVYIPERNRLLMLIAHDYPHHASIISSDDGGTTWSFPKYVHTDDAGKPDVGLGTSLTYLGGGKLILAAGRAGKEWYIPNWIWFSDDYGETWGSPTPFPKAVGKLEMNLWDPFFVDTESKTGELKRVIAAGYTFDAERFNSTGLPEYEQGGIRISTDGGRSWGPFVAVPEWKGVSEVTINRAANGNLVAACRTHWPERFRKQDFDHYEGLSASVSKDDGRTWSKLYRLYAWGRHHPSIVVLPSHDIVMSYVVRKGYPDSLEGYPQFGIEAIVSHDDGETWDLDHRYILTQWRGVAKGPNSWYASSQSTSTLRMPDGSLLTAFGTGYRSRDTSGKGRPQPRDIGLVSWKESKAPVKRDRTVTDSNWESNLRNEFNPDPDRHPVRSECPEAPGKLNIAVAEDGARASTSPSDGHPEYILHDAYSQSVLTLETLPAWVEIRWPQEHSIEEIHILPGAPMLAGRPSTECVPLDYRLQYQKDGQWIDLVPPQVNALRSRDFYGNIKAFITEDRAFEYIHKFSPRHVRAIRLSITRSSDSGQRTGQGSGIVVPEDHRETAIRSIEVFARAGK
jgi:hypothetical protein